MYEYENLTRGALTATNKASKSYFDAFSPIENRRRKPGDNSIYNSANSFVSFQESEVSVKNSLLSIQHKIVNNFQDKQKDPYSGHKKLTVGFHPLFQDSAEKLWAILKPDTVGVEKHSKQVIAYSHYKDFRVAMLKCFRHNFKYEEVLCRVWDEWNKFINAENSKEKELFESFKHFNFTKGKMEFEDFSKILVELVFQEVTEVDTLTFVFVLNSVILNSSSGDTLESSELKSWESICAFSDKFFKILNNLKKTNYKIAFSNWYQQNFSFISDVKNHCKELLSVFFPGDNRITGMLEHAKNPDKTQVLAQCINILNEPPKDPKSPLVPKRKSVKTPSRAQLNQPQQRILEIQKKVKLPVLGKSYLSERSEAKPKLPEAIQEENYEKSTPRPRNLDKPDSAPDSPANKLDPHHLESVESRYAENEESLSPRFTLKPSKNVSTSTVYDFAKSNKILSTPHFSNYSRKGPVWQAKKVLEFPETRNGPSFSKISLPEIVVSGKQVNENSKQTEESCKSSRYYDHHYSRIKKGKVKIKSSIAKLHPSDKKKLHRPKASSKKESSNISSSSKLAKSHFKTKH